MLFPQGFQKLQALGVSAHWDGRAWGKEARVLRGEPGRWKAAATSAGLWAGWEPVAFVLGSGPDGTNRVLLCHRARQKQALPQEGRRPELRAPPSLQEGAPVTGEAQDSAQSCARSPEVSVVPCGI